jgi:hypothetical protein
MPAAIWCFIYNDKTAGIFETHNIYTMRLNDFPLCDWIAEGHGFVAALKKRRTLARSTPSVAWD